MAKERIDYDLSLTDDMTVRDVERIYNEAIVRGLRRDDEDIKRKTSAVVMWKTINNLRFTSDAASMKIRELREWATIVRTAFIMIHRVNYSAYNTMSVFYDWYGEKRWLTPNIKRFWKKTEECFNRYQAAHRECQETDSWYLLQDSMRLLDDAIQEPLSHVEPAILNVLIRQRGGKKVTGQVDDLELLAKAEIPLLWMRVIRHSFNDFFRQYIDKCGVDFAYDFKYADLTGMSRNFCFMLGQMGVKLKDNKDCDKVLEFFDIDKSSTVETAWEAMMRVVRDENIADEKVGEALRLNGKAMERYASVVEDEERKQMSASLAKLKETYNVGRL